jgi:thiol:disulfide interchange protein DsbD
LAAFLLIALGAWMLWRWPRTSASGRSYVLSRTGAAIMILAALAVGLRGTRSQPGPATDESWQPFSAARVVELQASGRPVFIDFTAAWCLTCKVNERVVLETEAIEEAFRRRDVVLLKADWTRQDPEITRALEAFGRTGVPLYVLYTGATDAPPIILPTILTKETLLEALEGI